MNCVNLTWVYKKSLGFSISGEYQSLVSSFYPIEILKKNKWWF